MPSKTYICSIFTQIGSVVADAMAAEGKVHKIERDMIPLNERWNRFDVQAYCALVFTKETEAEFDRRVAQLRM